MRKLLHQEILRKRLTVDESKAAVRNPVSLMLYNVRSLYNVGSIFRTADSGLAKELILCGYTPHPPRKEIEKTALGAVDCVPWRYFKDTSEAISTLKKEGNKIIALEITDSQKSYDSLDIYEFPVCFILGNELSGIDDDIIKLCDDAVEIPMYGVKHSLNVSVAAGIILFEAIRILKYNYQDIPF